MEIIKPDQNLKKGLNPNTDSYYDKNYKKIFNICLYSFNGCCAIIIIFSFFRSWADFVGSILNIFLNIGTWIFIFFIFRFRKNHTLITLVMSIIFGFLAIVSIIYSIIDPTFQSLK